MSQSEGIGRFLKVAVLLAPVVLVGCKGALPERYECTPDFMRVERLEDRLKVTGHIVAPTPGYIYVLDTEEMPWRLSLSAPDKMVVETTSHVSVREVVAPPAKPFKDIVIEIKRNYRHGEDTVRCSPVLTSSARRES